MPSRQSYATLPIAIDSPVHTTLFILALMQVCKNKWVRNSPNITANCTETFGIYSPSASQRAAGSPMVLGILSACREHEDQAQILTTFHRLKAASHQKKNITRSADVMYVWFLDVKISCLALIYRVEGAKFARESC